MAIEQIEGKVKIQFPYMEFFIGIIILKFLFETYVNIRQFKLYKLKKIPTNVINLQITDEEFKSSQDYSFDKLGFEMLLDALGTTKEIIFLMLFIKPYIWSLSGRLLPFIDNSSEFQRGCVFIIIEMVMEKLSSIPISLYKSFVLEEKHGFNKLTIMQFIKDQLLSLLITLLIFPVFVYFFLLIIEKGGKYFFIYVQIFIMLFSFIMMYIIPNFIMPLFNKFEILEDGPLKSSINQLAHKIQFPLTKIYKMDGSKRSAHSNAFFYGFGKNKRIVLFDTLFNHLNNEEILAVMGHELGHWKFNHFWKQMIISFVNVFVIFYVYSFFRNDESLFVSFGFNEKSILIGTMLFVSILEPLNYFVQILTLKLSRIYEFQADNFAITLGLGEQMRSGLIKLFQKNKSNLISDKLYAELNYSHPTLLERVEAIDNKCPPLQKQQNQQNEEKQQSEEIQQNEEQEDLLNQQNQSENQENQELESDIKKNQ